MFTTAEASPDISPLRGGEEDIAKKRSIVRIMGHGRNTSMESAKWKRIFDIRRRRLVVRHLKRRNRILGRMKETYGIF
jgi:hypothetical protein